MNLIKKYIGNNNFYNDLKINDTIKIKNYLELHKEQELLLCSIKNIIKCNLETEGIICNCEYKYRYEIEIIEPDKWRQKENKFVCSMLLKNFQGKKFVIRKGNVNVCYDII